MTPYEQLMRCRDHYLLVQPALGAETKLKLYQPLVAAFASAPGLFSQEHLDAALCAAGDLVPPELVRARHHARMWALSAVALLIALLGVADAWIESAHQYLDCESARSSHAR